MSYHFTHIGMAPILIFKGKITSASNALKKRGSCCGKLLTHETFEALHETVAALVHILLRELKAGFGGGGSCT